MPKNTLTLARKYGAKIVAATGATLALAPAFAEDPATALAALISVSTANTGYGPVLWGLAVTAVGIMIGIKWIKRGRGAA